MKMCNRLTMRVLLAALAFGSVGLAAPTGCALLPESAATTGQDAWDVNREGVQVVEEGGLRFIRITNLSIEKVANLERTVALEAGAKVVVISARMRVRGLQLGKEGWHEPRVALRFQNDKAEQVGGYPSMPNLRENSDWVNREVILDIPEGATRIHLQPGLWLAAGTFDIDQLQVRCFVSKKEVNITPSAEVFVEDGSLPPQLSLGWGQEKVQAVSSTRGEIWLNGLWKFAPAEGSTAKYPSKGFGYIKVPGSWKEGVGRDIVARGETREWLNFDGPKLARAWYQRTIKIPADWQGRQILLDLDRVSTDATVFVDGKEVGKVNWPCGSVDLTTALADGKEHDLRLYVIAVDDRKQVPVYMGYVTDEMKPASLDAMGVIGGVKLLSRPKGVSIADVYVRPSTRQNKLNVDVELASTAAGLTGQFTAELLDEKGNVEKTFMSEAAIPQPTNGPAKLSLSWDWANPRLWDLQQPNLYTLRLTMKAGGSTDVYVQTFGFREFWIDGRKFYLNNSEIRLRPGNLDYGGKASDILKHGMNLGHIWPKDLTRRGSKLDYPDELIAEADKAGIMISANAPHMGEYASKIREWREDASLRADYRKQVDVHINRWRNHPSVVMWTHSANVFQNQIDGTPWLLGKKDFSNVQEYVARMENVQAAIAMIKEVDAARPVFAHFGTYAGEVYTSNMYLNFIPLQEREEWISEWAVNGQMPFMAVEFGMPLYASAMRGRDGYSHQGQSEPMLSEWSSRYLGTKAYTLEAPEYRKLLVDRYKGNDLQAEYDPHIRQNKGDEIIWKSPGFSAILDLYVTNTWRSWRTMGITGGMVPWHSESHPAVARNNSPTLAWIAGEGGLPDGADKPAFTSKDHNFFSAATVKKQLALINDYRTAQPYEVRWEAVVGGKQLAGDTLRGELAIAESKLLPISMVLPSVGSGRLDGVITLVAKIGPDEHRDQLALSVFPRVIAKIAEVAIFDPAGETSAMLKSLGLTPTSWQTGKITAKTLLIGRKALSGRGEAFPADLAAFVRDGGRLLVMGQDPRWLEYALQLRTAEHVARRVFSVVPDHPVMQNLQDANLADWAGAGTLIEDRSPLPMVETVPSKGWRWGNRGSVSSAAVEKPHRSSWRPILETEFDLAYSPLMEMEYGKGRVTLCTLDLEDYVDRDGAARLLASQLLEHVTTSPIAAKAQQTVYLGDPAGLKTLADIGVKHSGAGDLAGAQLAILGPGAEVDQKIRSFAEAGGKVLVLRRTSGEGVNKVDAFHGSTQVPNWPEAAGLSASDLHWKTDGEAYLLKQAPGLELAAGGQLARQVIGKGVIVFAQVSPEAVPADQKHYFRFTRWRQTRALSQLLANLGASFKQDDAMLALLSRPGFYENLCGTWDVQLTTPVSESLYREWNADRGLSETAQGLISAGTGGDGWEQRPVPAFMESYGGKWRFTDGECVYRKAIDVPAHLAGKDLFFCLGRVDETEQTYINGTSVGKSRSWLLGRGHVIPGNLVKAGQNIITLRTWDEGIHGGFCSDPAQLYVRSETEDAGFYHPDYRDDHVGEGTQESDWAAQSQIWKVADNPYRYYRW